MRNISFYAALGVTSIFAACSQPEAPSMVTPEPVFDKYGGGTCEEGYDFVAGTSAQPPVCIPDDGCEPVFDSAGNVIDCPPPPRQPGGGDSTGRPTGSSTTPGAGSTAPVT